MTTFHAYPPVETLKRTLWLRTIFSLPNWFTGADSVQVVAMTILTAAVWTLNLLAGVAFESCIADAFRIFFVREITFAPARTIIFANFD